MSERTLPLSRLDVEIGPPLSAACSGLGERKHRGGDSGAPQALTATPLATHAVVFESEWGLGGCESGKIPSAATGRCWPRLQGTRFYSRQSGACRDSQAMVEALVAIEAREVHETRRCQWFLALPLPQLVPPWWLLGSFDLAGKVSKRVKSYRHHTLHTSFASIT